MTAGLERALPIRASQGAQPRWQSMHEAAFLQVGDGVQQVLRNDTTETDAQGGLRGVQQGSNAVLLYLTV